MKRAEMVCVNCIKYDALVNSENIPVVRFCRLNPESHPFRPPVGLPVNIDGTTPEITPVPVNAIRSHPDFHWCAQGEWREWSDRHKEWEPYLWGEWDRESPE